MSDLEEVREEVRKKIKEAITYRSGRDFDKIGTATLEEIRGEILSNFDVEDYSLREQSRGPNNSPLRYFEFSLRTKSNEEMDRIDISTKFANPKFIIITYENSSQLILQTLSDNTLFCRVFTLNGYLRRLNYNPVKQEMEKYLPRVEIADKNISSDALDRRFNPETDMELEGTANVHL